MESTDQFTEPTDRIARLARQDHNGFTHQDPGFLGVVTKKSAAVVRIYLPPDANWLLSAADHCLRSTDYVNVIVADFRSATHKSMVSTVSQQFWWF